MTKLDISLPDRLKVFVEEQAATGGYGTAGEYIQALIREAWERQDLEAKLLEALEEEPSTMSEADWEGLRKRVAQADHGRSA
ncbi:MAG TPA: type II toxin-antitoxin system ParD family antitoxin [Thermoanaerobaculia bacterium]|nr:type II toxin-antitoxin system ParD family antitoxin [Thermoanaerobaculia bacterium]